VSVCVCLGGCDREVYLMRTSWATRDCGARKTN
jgi:hypothetical protein